MEHSKAIVCSRRASLGTSADTAKTIREITMAAESPFVEIVQSVAKEILRDPPWHVVRHAPLLYEITVSNSLQVMSQECVRKPKRGASAFQTDLCIFEKLTPEILIPRVVIEFKTKITTHDILTYNAKAAKHKQIYPYLRYGILASGEKEVPGRVFTHNESLDFFASVSGLKGDKLRTFLEHLLKSEVATSRQLENIAFSKVHCRLFRTEVQISEE